MAGDKTLSKQKPHKKKPHTYSTTNGDSQQLANCGTLSQQKENQSHDVKREISESDVKDHDTHNNSNHNNDIHQEIKQENSEISYDYEVTNK